MFLLHTTGKEVQVVVQALSRFIHALAAGKDDVGLLHQFLLALGQVGCCPFETDQIIHDIIDNQIRRQMIKHVVGQGCVEPEDERPL